MYDRMITPGESFLAAKNLNEIEKRLGHTVDNNLVSASLLKHRLLTSSELDRVCYNLKSIEKSRSSISGGRYATTAHANTIETVGAAVDIMRISPEKFASLVAPRKDLTYYLVKLLLWSAKIVLAIVIVILAAVFIAHLFNS